MLDEMISPESVTYTSWLSVYKHQICLPQTSVPKHHSTCCIWTVQKVKCLFLRIGVSCYSASSYISHAKSYPSSFMPSFADQGKLIQFTFLYCLANGGMNISPTKP